ncbi:FG-GAP repeat domain-containing protein [Ekhidna sp.]
MKKFNILLALLLLSTLSMLVACSKEDDVKMEEEMLFSERIVEVTSPFEGMIDSDIVYFDADGDNDEDVIVIGSSKSSRYISKLFIRNQEGLLNDVSTPFLGVKDGSISVSDIDSDGDKDVLITGDSAFGLSTRLYRNNGNAQFQMIDTPFNGVWLSSSDFDDVDDDGDSDLILVGSTNSGNIAKLYLNDGEGNFTLKGDTPFQGISGKVAFSDVNGDQDPDVIFNGRDNNGILIVHLYLNDGNGNFVWIEKNPFRALRSGWMDFSDVNGDDLPDVLLSGTGGVSFNTLLYINNGGGSFSQSTDALPFAQVQGEAEFADINRDGIDDVIEVGLTFDQVQNKSSLEASLYLGNGDGTFELVEETPFEGMYLGSVGISSDGKEIILFGTNGNQSEYLSKMYRIE